MSQEVATRLAEIDARWKSAAEGPWQSYEGALVDVAFLREQLRKNGEMANLLLDMPRRISNAIRRECPEPAAEHVGDHCDYWVAANLALNIGDLVVAELRDMDAK